MTTELDLTPEARPYLVRAAGQHGRVTVPLQIPEAAEGLSVPGNPGTFVELEYEVTPTGGLIVRPWIDGAPADTPEVPEL